MSYTTKRSALQIPDISGFSEYMTQINKARMVNVSSRSHRCVHMFLLFVLTGDKRPKIKLNPNSNSTNRITDPRKCILQSGDVVGWQDRSVDTQHAYTQLAY